MRIAIVGASRGCGLATVKEALSRGHAVTALARTQAPLSAPGLDWIAADARDTGALTRALAGSDAVVSAIGKGGSLGKVTLFSTAMAALIPAMQAAGIARLVAITGIGAGDSRGHGGFFYDRLLFPLVLARVYADKDVSEAMIRKSALEWTIVRPGVLTDGKRTGRVKAMTTPATYRGGSISRADVALFILDCLEQRSFLHQTPAIVRG